MSPALLRLGPGIPGADPIEGSANASTTDGGPRELGYTVPQSQANFVWATRGPPAPATFERLKAECILVGS